MSANVEQKVDELRDMLRETEMKVLTEGYTLADALRHGIRTTTQEYGWGDGDTACFLSAAYLGARACGAIEE